MVGRQLPGKRQKLQSGATVAVDDDIWATPLRPENKDAAELNEILFKCSENSIDALTEGAALNRPKVSASSPMGSLVWALMCMLCFGHATSADAIQSGFEVAIHSASGVPDEDPGWYMGLSDPYVVLSFLGEECGRTFAVRTQLIFTPTMARCGSRLPMLLPLLSASMAGLDKCARGAWWAGSGQVTPPHRRCTPITPLPTR